MRKELPPESDSEEHSDVSILNIIMCHICYGEVAKNIMEGSEFPSLFPTNILQKHRETVGLWQLVFGLKFYILCKRYFPC